MSWVIPVGLIFIASTVVSVNPFCNSETDNRELQNESRKTLIQFFGVVGTIATLFYTAQTYRMDREKEVTSSLAAAFSNIYHQEETQRVGAILTLSAYLKAYPEHRALIVSLLTVNLNRRVPVKTLASTSDLSITPNQATTQQESSPQSQERLEGCPYEIEATLCALGIDSISKSVRSSTKLRRLNFSRAEIADLRLDNYDFEGSHFNEAALLNVSFVSTDLSDVNFENSTLTNVDFTDADLTRADFTAVDLSTCNIENAKNREKAIGLTFPGNED